MVEETDILVLGSGVAGLFFALKASQYADVTILTKKESYESNTYYAQGGIASVVNDEDSFELHVRDTLEAGQGLCNRRAVEIMVTEGPNVVRELIELGISFTMDSKNGSFHLHREGGHSVSRILHYGDMTGRIIEKGLLKEVLSRGNIDLRENCMAVDIITDSNGRASGVLVLDESKKIMKVYRAKAVVLATGGAGKIYLYTSNPDIATGDGIAMAYRAGADIANLEFVQFHPTCLYHPEAKSFLISESLRGEGAVLRNLAGEAFMKKYDARAELAPRDVVARAIDMEMKKSGDKYVLLDISFKPRDWLEKRFPNVFSTCLSFGIDMSIEPIPVVPAAHYMCGGVKTDINGVSSIPGLYAIGEVACSGVHGANRLASNSLLEAMVMANRCSNVVREELKQGVSCGEIDYEDKIPSVADKGVMETVILDHDWDLTRRIMWDYVGIVRSVKRLRIAQKRIQQVRETIKKFYKEHGASIDILELRNISLVSSLVVESALLRKESRGLHYVIDYPEKDEKYSRDTLISKDLLSF